MNNELRDIPTMPERVQAIWSGPLETTSCHVYMLCTTHKSLTADDKCGTIPSRCRFSLLRVVVVRMTFTSENRTQVSAFSPRNCYVEATPGHLVSSSELRDPAASLRGLAMFCTSATFTATAFRSPSPPCHFLCTSHIPSLAYLPHLSLPPHIPTNT
jgi:hypothetical protein